MPTRHAWPRTAPGSEAEPGDDAPSSDATASPALRADRWPGQAAPNLYVALPTFDGVDRAAMVGRLRRDGAVNLPLAAAVPYAAPPLATAIGAAHGVTVVGNDLVLVWVVVAWAFLPATLILRGLALRRLASVLAARPDRWPASPESFAAAFSPHCWWPSARRRRGPRRSASPPSTPGSAVAVPG